MFVNKQLYTCPGLGLFLISVSRGQGATLAPLKKKNNIFFQFQTLVRHKRQKVAEKKTVKLSNEEEMETNVEENPVPLLIPINQADLLVFSSSYFVVLPLADLGKLFYFPFFSIYLPIFPTTNLSNLEQYAVCNVCAERLNIKN